MAKFPSRSFLLHASLCAALAGCASTPPADVPAALKEPAGEVLVNELHAKGVQVYACKPAKNDPTHFAWAFVQPEADLFTSGGTKAGKHYAGPTWEANDGSKVVGEVVASVNSPQPGAIAWLLLGAKANYGKGKFEHVNSIQRLHTVGGAAPAGGCSQAQAGQELRASYTADYLFYAARN
jgi:Protein of unknown function (DUF3455)